MKADELRGKKSVGWPVLGVAALFCALTSPAAAQTTCPVNTDNINVSGVVNTYYPPTTTGTLAAGSTSVTISRRPANVLGADENIAIGDLLIIMQMQDANINATNTGSYGDGTAGDPASGSAVNNSGKYEYVIAQSAVTLGNGGAATSALTFIGAGANNGTLFSYRLLARTTTDGQRTYQVIKVRRYRNATLSGVITAPAWTGTLGGVVAMDVTGTFTLSGGTVNVAGLGFRGAPGQQLFGEGNGNLPISNNDYRRRSDLDAHGLKAEGIAGTNSFLAGFGTPTGYPTDTAADVNADRARGAPGNAGGGGSDRNPASNDQNSGGGGGGNGGPGGNGGNSWNSNAAVGGVGGALFAANAGQVVMGGGGGAGTRNNSDNIAQASSGANGGGIVLIRAGSIAGTGATVNADGATADLAAFTPENDSGGGGGAGGSVVFVARTGVSLANLTVLARGGRGANAWVTEPPGAFPGARHGPGGGGGGGVYFVSSALNGASSVAGGAGGYTTTAQDAYGSTGGTGSTNVSGGTDFDDIPGVQTCLTVTRAVIEGVRRVGGDLEFGVSSGRGVVGFNVIAETGSKKRVRLNDELLVAALPDALGPMLYRAPLRGLSPRRVWIEEVERGGRVRTMGPYLLGEPRLEEAYSNLEARASREQVFERQGARMITGPRSTSPRRIRPITRRRPNPGLGGVKVEVGQGGLVRLLPQDWPNAGGGVGPRSVDSARRRLVVTNLGRNVPYTVRDGVLEFVAESLSTDYTGTNAYLVTYGPPPAPQAALTRSGFALAPGFTRVEENVLYAPFAARGASPWIWDLALSGTSVNLAFDLPSLPGGGGNVPVRLGLIGASEHAHRVEAEINGVTVGELEFSGKAEGLLVGEVAAGTLQSTGNTLTLRYEAEGSTLEDPGLVFMDVLDLGLPPSTDLPLAEVTGIGPYDASLPDLRLADYLIVTHGDFSAAAERLRALKEMAGLRTLVVDVERAYDRFTGGVVDVSAVQALVREAARGRNLKYVLLVGDDSYDPQDFTGLGLSTFVPGPYGWDGVFGRVPSEVALSDTSGDGRPDVAIGRLPVRTAEEAAVLVDKIARQSTRPGQNRHLVAVDASQPGDISFRAAGDKLAAALPGAVAMADVGAQGVAAARTTLLGALQAGVRTTNYFGHGGFDVLSDQGLLRSSDVAALEGSGAETVLFTWTCETQWYVAAGRTLNEELLLVPNGGAVAALGPGGISDPVLQANLSQRVYDLLLRGFTLGRAVQKAKSDALAEDPRLSSVVEGFSLLGDPSLRP